jgi:hypothetical protein
MAARNFLLPGILTQARFLSYSQGGYGEAVTSAVAGPEWVIPLSLKRSVFFSFSGSRPVWLIYP